jgi:polyisoprenoid-binding protein YceI
MKKLTVITIFCLLTGPALFVGCQNPAEDKPEAEVAEPTASTAEPAADAVAYVMGSESKIGFVGSKVTGSHEGGFEVFTGQIHLVGGMAEGSHVVVDIDTTSLWADAEKLTKHLKSPDFFDVEQFPTARFESTSVTRDGGGYVITGNLDLHGVQKSISFPATIDVTDGTIRAQAEFSINRLDFGIVYAGMPDDLIREEVVIKLDLVAAPSAT